MTGEETEFEGSQAFKQLLPSLCCQQVVVNWKINWKDMTERNSNWELTVHIPEISLWADTDR